MGDNIKARVQAKMDEKKAKIAAKVKARKDRIAAKMAEKFGLLIAVALIVAGCMDTSPASRMTTAAYRDIVINIGNSSTGNTVNVELGDGATASADSSGSTETQTLTPSMDVKPDVDLNYNGPTKAATQAAGALETLLGGGASALVRWMAGSGTNTVTVVGANGTTNTAVCVDGKCTECVDGNCNPK